MKLFRKIINCITVFAILLVDFSFAFTVHAQEETSTYDQGEVVGGFVSAGSTEEPGGVYISKKVEKTDEEGVYEITLTVKGKNTITTESHDTPVYAVVVFDKSGSMSNYQCTRPRVNQGRCTLDQLGQTIPKYDNAVAGAKKFAETLFNSFENAEVAYAIFSSVSTPTQFFTSYEQVEAYDFGGPHSGTALSRGLADANSLLATKEGVNKYIVIMSDGAPDYGDPYQAQVDIARANGYKIYAIAYEDEGTVLKSIVDEPVSTHYSDGATSNIVATFESVAQQIEVEVEAGHNAVVIDEIGSGFSYVEGSADLEGHEAGSNEVTVSGQTVSFNVGTITEEGTVVKLRIKINEDLEPGLYDTNGLAKVTYDEGEVVIEDSPKVYVKGYTYTVKYLDSVTGQPLSDEVVRTNKLYKHTYSENAVDIEGYEVDEESKSVTITQDNMEIIFYYSIKTDLTYIVEYFNDILNSEAIGSDEFGDQTYNTQISEEDVDVNKYQQYGYQAGEIQTDMPYTITEGPNVIQVLYRRRNDFKYTVEYKDRDTNESVIASETRTGKTYLETYQEEAKEAPFGYVLDSDTTQDVFMDRDDKVVTFYYKKRNDFKYTVKYLEEGTEKELADEKEVTGKTYKAEVTEEAKTIPGYKLVGEESQTITLTEDDMVITFYYTIKEDLTYIVEYFNDAMDISNLTGSDEFDNQTYNTQITAEDIDVNKYQQYGYQAGEIQTDMPYTIIDGTNKIQILYRKRNDFKYTVEYRDRETTEEILDKESRTGKTYLETYQEEAKEAPFGYVLDSESTQNVVMDSDDKVVTFYYNKRNDFKYTVKYLEEGTEKELADEKEVTGKTYLDEVTETAKEIPGYNVDAETKTTTIDEEDKEIIFYYSIKTNLTYTVNYYRVDEEGNELLGSTTVENVTYNTQINASDIDVNLNRPEGYKDGEIQTEMPYTIIDGENVIDVYYRIKDDLTYRVEYYFDGIIDSSKTEYFENIVYGTVISTYPDKLPEGYKFDSDTGELVVKDTEENVIKVYYSKVEDEIEAPVTSVNVTNYQNYILGFIVFILLLLKLKLLNAIFND